MEVFLTAVRDAIRLKREGWESNGSRRRYWPKKGPAAGQQVQIVAVAAVRFLEVVFLGE
jgi:hypothetical protein